MRAAQICCSENVQKAIRSRVPGRETTEILLLEASTHMQVPKRQPSIRLYNGHINMDTRSTHRNGYLYRYMWKRTAMKYGIIHAVQHFNKYRLARVGANVRRILLPPTPQPQYVCAPNSGLGRDQKAYSSSAARRLLSRPSSPFSAVHKSDEEPWSVVSRFCSCHEEPERCRP